MENKATPGIRKEFGQATAEIVVQLNCLKLGYGYKDQSSIQVRLNPDGTIYASIFDDFRVKNRSLTVDNVTFDTFLDVMRDAISAMRARSVSVEMSRKG